MLSMVAACVLLLFCTMTLTALSLSGAVNDTEYVPAVSALTETHAPVNEDASLTPILILLVDMEASVNSKM